MAEVKSTLQREEKPMPDADRLLGAMSMESPAVMGYLTSVAVMVGATIVAVAVDSGVTIPNMLTAGPNGITA